MAAKRISNAEMEAIDNEQAKWNAEQKRLLAIEQKLEAAGLNLDDLIDLIAARQSGKY
ncbi:MAG TPA: hypothetical protein PLD10_16275 [Rhodopila sp.]|nr:hypothetical protein [Rhodopila sp.]